jgi:putative FmdB family regulatory protein
MPLYEYQCDACSHRFERIQKFSDPHADTCPKCGGAVHKLLSSPAIQFKGTGWYITDYAKKSSPDSGKNNSSASGGGDSASSSSDKGDKGSEKANSTGSGSSSSGSGSGSSSGGSSSGSGSSS